MGSRYSRKGAGEGAGKAWWWWGGDLVGMWTEWTGESIYTIRICYVWGNILRPWLEEGRSCSREVLLHGEVSGCLLSFG